MTVSLLDENLPSFSQPKCSTEGDNQNIKLSSEDESDSTDDSSCKGYLNKLRCELEKATPDGLRHRQLSMLLKSAEHQGKACTKAIRDHRLTGRRKSLVDLGVASASQVDSLITNPDSPLPPILEQREQHGIKDWAKRLQAQKRREDQEKVERVFSNPWLLDMEREMADSNWRRERTEVDAEMCDVLTSLLEINSEKLRAFHERQGTLGLQAAIERRKIVSLERGWVESACANCVRDVYSPLPVIVDASNLSGSGSDRPMLLPGTSTDGTDEDDNVLVGPPTIPSYERSTEPCVMFTPPFTPSQETFDYDEEEMFETPKTPSYTPKTDENFRIRRSPRCP